MRPDIRIPVNNQPALEGLIMREYASFAILCADRSGEAIPEQNQCEANFNTLLDHYPGGVRRPEVSAEQTNEAIARLGQKAVAA